MFERKSMVRSCISALCMGMTLGVHAGDVAIEAVVFAADAPGRWTVRTTLRHADTGWEHYADAWRVVDGEGRELGVRTLYHPHVNEQLFTRSLSGVSIGPESGVVWVEAHDKVHGWSGARIRIDLSKDEGPGYRVER